MRASARAPAARRPPRTPRAARARRRFELVTGGADGLLLVWDGSRKASHRKRLRDALGSDDEDDWSDDGAAPSRAPPPATHLAGRDDFASAYLAAARGE